MARAMRRLRPQDWDNGEAGVTSSIPLRALGEVQYVAMLGIGTPRQSELSVIIDTG